jgi:hypothetical protein
MTGFGDTPRDLAEFVTDTRRRITSLERRVRSSAAPDTTTGGGGGGTTGTPVDPMVISAESATALNPTRTMSRTSAGTALTTAGAVIVGFDFLELGRVGTFSYVNGVWTCLVAGVYVISCAVSVGVASAPTHVQVSVQKNNVGQSVMLGRADAVIGSSVQVPSFSLPMAVNDTLRIVVLRGNAGTVSLAGDATRTWFSINS